MKTKLPINIKKNFIKIKFIINLYKLKIFPFFTLSWKDFFIDYLTGIFYKHHLKLELTYPYLL